MSLRVWALASGSSGNSFLVQGGNTTVLLDAGFPMRTIRGKIASVGVDPALVEAVFLTHEHSDHVGGVGPVCRAFKVPLVANAATLRAAARVAGSTEAMEMPTGTEIQIGDLRVASFAVSHDAAEPVGYTFQCGPHKACYATDTGVFTEPLRAAMEGARLLILESNHDIPRLQRSAYNDFLKRRILGDSGHLSNDAAADAIAAHSLRNDPAEVWLAHLSAENNSPRLAMKAAVGALRAGRPENIRLFVAQRDVVSRHWDSGANWWQKSLF
ncbi:MAG TPA: MBL fold metallo-hydrolase [Armatimonadota bacterium]